MEMSPEYIVEPTPVATLPGTASPTQEVAPPLDDAAVRAALAKADQEGTNVVELNRPTQTPPPAPVEVPQKFVKPDGTVDEEKIKASTKQLDEAIAQKQEAVKSVEDYIREYKEKEREFKNLPNPNNLLKQVQQPSQEMPMGRAVSELMAPQADPELEQIRQRILEDYRRDPLGTTVDFAVAKAKAEMAPALQYLEQIKEAQATDAMRKNIAEIAERDARILSPEVFSLVNQILKDNPEMRHLKNPHKAAWLEAKERLRLGEQSAPVQPSRPTPSPILGGGTPPPVPSSQGSVNAQALLSAISAPGGKITKDQEKALDDEIRRLMMRSDSV